MGYEDSWRTAMTFLVILALVVALALFVIALYNRLVKMRNTVKSAWADIDVLLRKRYNLVGNLVETVKGYAA
ncbi:LemA family protein, partial [bacterium]|nr:LemA family protein [bacterium]